MIANTAIKITGDEPLFVLREYVVPRFGRNLVANGEYFIFEFQKKSFQKNYPLVRKCNYTSYY